MTSDLVTELIDEAEKCVNCGFCESVCPTLPASGYNSIIGARGRVNIGKALWRDIKANEKTELRIADSFYSCLDCYACVQVCPAGVNAGKVSNIAKRIITSKEHTVTNQEKATAKMIVEATLKFKNPLGVREKCAEWASQLQFDDNSDTLLYTGNMYQLMAYSKSIGNLRQSIGEKFEGRFSRLILNHPSLIKASKFLYDKDTKRKMENSLRSITTLLQTSGVKFTYLREEEPYPGTFIFDLGYINDFISYARYVVDLLKSKGIKRIITIDPHTYDLMRNEYPKYIPDFDIEVVHYLDLLKSTDFESSDENITFHEPCHFVLRSERYDEPLRFLRGIANVSLPKKNGNHTFCCGGPDELLFGKLSEKISDSRFSQLKDTGTNTIITACPICYVNLAKDESVRDISDFLASQKK